jgi:hypothetical protein
MPATAEDGDRMPKRAGTTTVPENLTAREAADRVARRLRRRHDREREPFEETTYSCECCGYDTFEVEREFEVTERTTYVLPWGVALTLITPPSEPPCAGGRARG